MIEQEINKMAVHTNIIFRPRNTMFSLMLLLSFMVNSALKARFHFGSHSSLSLFVNQMSYTVCKIQHRLQYNLV